MLHSIDSFGILKVSMSQIRVERLEERIKPAVAFPHKHDFYQVMLVTRGTGTHQIDFVHHKVSPGKLYLMKPGQMHSWKLAKNVKGFLVEFNRQSLNAFRDSARLIQSFEQFPDAEELKGNTLSELQTLIGLMAQEFKGQKEMQDLALQGYLNSFLIQLVRNFQHELKAPKTISLIEKFKDLLEKHYRQEHAVEFYAKKLSTSPAALTMQLARSLGKPPRQLIQERILLEAKRFLAFSELSIAQIGYELGFDDANYFTRFFRLHQKISPAAFRKSCST